MVSKRFLAVTLACGLAITATALRAQPRVSVISQWSAGAEGDAMNAFGAMVSKAGATWEHHPVSGYESEKEG